MCVCVGGGGGVKGLLACSQNSEKRLLASSYLPVCVCMPICLCAVYLPFIRPPVCSHRKPRLPLDGLNEIWYWKIFRRIVEKNNV